MALNLCRDLDSRNVVFDHSFVFHSRSFDLKSLITRYRGTVCTPDHTGKSIITAWQKSLYRFGGIHLEETVVVTILVRPDGVVHGLSVDEKSHGGLGPLCDFRELQRCMNRILRGRKFADFARACPTAGDARCLHLFEILSGASSFYAELRSKGLDKGAEEELLSIRPQRGEILAENRHWVLGRETRMTLSLRHLSKPRTNFNRLPMTLNVLLRVQYQDQEVICDRVEAADFHGVYGKLNRVLSKCCRLEKDAFDVKGRMRFTNTTSFVGLLLLTISHESMHLLRSFRIERVLHFLQAGGERPNCIGFGKLQDTYH